MYHQVNIGIWVGALFSLILHVGGAGLYFHIAKSSKTSPLRLEVVTAAVLVRKGKPRAKHLLPRIYKKRPPKTTRKHFIRRNNKKKRSRHSRRRRLSDRERMKRALELARRYSHKKEDFDDRAEYTDTLTGRADGDKDGTALTAQIGSIYGARLTKKIEDNMEFPEILTERQRKQCRQRIQVIMFLQRNGKLKRRGLRLLRKSGDRRCDNAVLAAIKRSSPFPSPPDKIWPLIKNGVTIRLASGP